MSRSFRQLVKSVSNMLIQINRGRATELLEFEVRELENIFSLLVLGGFAGLPSPPSPVAVELLPFLEKELIVLVARTDLAQDPIGVLAGMMEVG